MSRNNPICSKEKGLGHPPGQAPVERTRHLNKPVWLKPGFNPVVAMAEFLKRQKVRQERSKTNRRKAWQ